MAQYCDVKASSVWLAENIAVVTAAENSLLCVLKRNMLRLNALAFTLSLAQDKELVKPEGLFTSLLVFPPHGI